MAEMIWQCDQLRAGQLYNRMIFLRKEEALEFVQTMREMEPDQVISMLAIEASQVWN